MTSRRKRKRITILSSSCGCFSRARKTTELSIIHVVLRAVPFAYHTAPPLFDYHFPLTYWWVSHWLGLSALLSIDMSPRDSCVRISYLHCYRWHLIRPVVAIACLPVIINVESCDRVEGLPIRLDVFDKHETKRELSYEDGLVIYNSILMVILKLFEKWTKWRLYFLYISYLIPT